MSGELSWEQKVSLSRAAIEGIIQKRIDVVEGCLKMGAEPDYPLQQSEGNGYARPLLHWAVVNYDPKVCGLVLRYASVDSTDRDNDTALHMAVNTRNTEAIAQLVRAGANPLALNNGKRTPFDNARDLSDAGLRCDILALLTGSAPAAETETPVEKETAAKPIEAVPPVVFKPKPKAGGGFSL